MTFLSRMSQAFTIMSIRQKRLKNDNCLKGAMVIQLLTIVKGSTVKEWTSSYCINHAEEKEHNTRDIIRY